MRRLLFLLGLCACAREPTPRELCRQHIKQELLAAERRGDAATADRLMQLQRTGKDCSHLYGLGL